MDEINETTLSRIKAMGLLFTMIFVILLTRLWLLQGVQGQEFKRLSEDNRIRQIPLDAQRGQILDRNLEPIVQNRPSVVLTLKPDQAKDNVLLKRLAKLLHMSISEVKGKVRSKKVNPIEPKVIKRDVSPNIVAYFEEHKNDYIGAELVVKPIRDYPQDSMAAHVLGYLGELSDKEAKESEFTTYDLGDLVGKTGVEQQYESLLAGNKGTQFVEVNAAGDLLRVIEKKDPVPGNNIILTLDTKIQLSSEKALKNAIASARKSKFPNASAGAVVVMKPDGEVLAMAGYPTYDPRDFVGGVSQSRWAEMIDEKSDYPLNNRAIMSAYPPGSTFKPVTAVAGLKTGVINIGTSFVCRGRWTGLGKKWPKWCWDRTGHGRQALDGALSKSCDTYFYEVGHGLYKKGAEDLQKWARRLGFGSRTGIDLPSEIDGRVPTAAWKREFNVSWPENQQWFPGDTVNMAIGQGDVLATPLQIANLYAAIANGGTIYQPRIVKAVKGLEDRTILEVKPKKTGEIGLSPPEAAAIKRGLRRVVVDGTAKNVFRGFTPAVSGKTGTSEVIGKDDFAFFVAFAPTDDPQYVVLVVIEQGGHGGDAAAPAVREIIDDIFHPQETTHVAGDRT